MLEPSEIDDLAMEIAREAYAYSIGKIPSTTLRNDVRIVRTGVGSAELRIDYYWAVIVHSGRKGVSGKGGVLVFFRNPDDDPRLRSGYPRTRAEVVRGMTSNEWEYWKRRNREARRSGEPEPMVVVDSVGPALKYRNGGAHPARFWDNSHGMLGFPEIGRRIIARALTAKLRSAMKGYRPS